MTKKVETNKFIKLQRSKHVFMSEIDKISKNFTDVIFPIVNIRIKARQDAERLLDVISWYNK